MKRLPLMLTALMFSSAAVAQEVNIYSARQPELIDPILEKFTEETGIKTNVVFLKSGMIERLKAEGERSPADIILTTDIANLSAIVDAGVTQPVTSEVIEANIPESYRDPEGDWFGLTMRARIIYASKDRVTEGEVVSYEDLADPKWKGRICVRSGLHNYNIALLSAVVEHHGEEEAEKWLQGVKDNLARKPQGNDRAQVKAVWAGECDIAIGNTYYMGKMMSDPEQTEWANSVNLYFPTIAGAGAHVNLSGMAMTASSPNKDDAMKLMEFLSSETAQKLYAELNFEYPLLESVSPSELVSSWGTFEADPTPLTDIAGHRPVALQIVERVNFDE